MARMRLTPALLAGVALAVASGAASASNQAAQPSPLIERDVLFGNPDRAAPQISPDGKRIAFLAPWGGVLNVWVGPAENPDAARPVTNDRVRGIRIFSWTYTNDHILFMQDKGGDENFHVFVVDLANANETRDLTPYPGARATIQQVSRDIPDEILVTVNNRDPRVFDVHRVNIRTGESKLVEQNDQMYAGYLTDDRYRVRMASRFNPDGGVTHFLRTDAGDWEPLITVGLEDANNTAPMSFDKDGNTLYLMDSRDSNTSRLVALDLRSRKTTPIAANDKADLSNVLINPITRKVEAVSFNYLKDEWEYLDKSIGAEFENIPREGQRGRDRALTSRSKDDSRLDRHRLQHNGPVRYYLYDRATRARPSSSPTTSGSKDSTSRRCTPWSSPRATGSTSSPTSPSPRGSTGTTTACPTAGPSHGPPRARRPVGARRLGLQLPAPVARQPRVRGPQRQLPRLHRVRQGLPQRRQPRVGQENAHGSSRRRRLGSRTASPAARSPSWAAPTAGTPPSRA